MNVATMMQPGRVRPTVLMDVDGVIADFVTAVLGHLSQLTGRQFDPGSVRTWEIFDSLHGVSDAHRDLAYARMALPGACRDIPALGGASEGVKRLREVADIVFVTSPLPSSPTWSHERAAWLEAFGARGADVIHAAAKSRVHGDIFVDDKPEHVRGWIDYWRDRDPACKGVLWTTPRTEHLALDLPRAGGWEALRALAERWGQ